MIGPDDPRHGTRNAYTSFGCRCQSCRAANTAYLCAYMRSHPEQQEKHRKRDRDAKRARRATRAYVVMAPNDPRHGTSNGYVNLGCRCQSCRAANAAHVRYYRANPANREKRNKQTRNAYRAKRAQA